MQVHEPLMGEPRKKDFNLAGTLSPSLAVLCLALVAAFCRLVDYTTENATDAHVAQYYTWYVHVSIMIFIGFGFLMTFLHRYSFSAVGLNFLASALTMLQFVVVGGYIQQILFFEASDDPNGVASILDAAKAHVAKPTHVLLTMPLLIDAAFCAGAAMISFGAVLGKCSPLQLVFLVSLEVPVYAFNQHLVFEEFKALDMGGSISIHAFGAFFGLAAALAMCKPGSGSMHPKNTANYTSDMFAMIGTLFLFIYWPSFNGALASRPPVSMLGKVHNPLPEYQYHCVTNTIISLLGATVATFAASTAVGNKLSMVHIQNATLAGGVAVGSCATLKILPGGALALGMVAGLVSTLGYAFVSPFLEDSIGLRDTCGVLNLHGMPGVLGGVAASVAAVVAYEANEGVMTRGKDQWMYNLLGTGATVLIASVSGYVAGKIVDFVDVKGQPLKGEQLFEDSVFWEHVAEEHDHEHVCDGHEGHL